jgi:hypothetical protein
MNLYTKHASPSSLYGFDRPSTYESEQFIYEDDELSTMSTCTSYFQGGVLHRMAGPATIQVGESGIRVYGWYYHGSLVADVVYTRHGFDYLEWATGWDKASWPFGVPMDLMWEDE